MKLSDYIHHTDNHQIKLTIPILLRDRLSNHKIVKTVCDDEDDSKPTDTKQTNRKCKKVVVKPTTIFQ